MRDETILTELKSLDKPRFVLNQGKKAKGPLIAQALRALVMSLEVGRSEASSLEMVGKQFEEYDIGRNMVRASEYMYSKGISFKAALISTDVLPDTAIGLIEASPTAQTLQANLIEAARLVTDGHQVKKMIVSSLASPAMMVGMILGLLYVSTIFLIPKFIESFDTLGSETPLMTIIVQKSAVVVSWMLTIVIGALLLTGLYWLSFGRRHHGSKKLKALLVLKTPQVGNIMQITATARLFRLLSANLETGVAESEALVSASRGCGNYYIESVCTEHAKKMSDHGARMSSYLESKAFPYVASAIVMSAPSVLQEIKSMKQLADEYERESKVQLELLNQTLTPILNYLVYGVAALLVIALMLPMYSIFDPLMKLA